jgi:hypothetical protein
MNKEEILREIKRTAAANGGSAPGWRKFERETGITYNDWFGKYWVRWSDAIREASLAPNQFTGSYDSSELLEKYAQLARALGRLPVSGDLRMKARNDPGFPHDRPFRRFGAKRELVSKLLEFCRSHDGYNDVARLCEEYAPRQPEVDQESSVSAENVGYVYLLKSGRFYKIGKANHAGRRNYELAIQLPERAREVHVIRTDDPNGIEAYWHNRFATKRKNGEWFDLDAADVKAFKRWKRIF